MTERTPGNPFAMPAAPGVERVPGPGDYGEPLGGEYAVVSVHRGGMGEVLVCERKDDPKQRIALKSFQKRLFFDATSRSAFIREAAIWTRLAGVPYVMPAIGLEYIDDRPFVRMPAIDQTLRDMLADRPLQTDEAATAATQLAIGMAAAAARVEGLVHGDLKPENLFLAPAGVLISDFGLARAGGDYALHLGTTWAYRAPECWIDPLAASPASDVYAFGAIVFELFFGSLPFVAEGEDEWMRAHLEQAPTEPSAASREGLGRQIAALATRCLAKDPGERPAGFESIRREILDYVHDSDPIQALTLAVEGARLAQEGASMREESGLFRAQTLAQLGEYELALEELDALPESAVTDEVLVERGNLLSLLDRDDEAVATFRVVLDGAPDDEIETRCLLLLGLSLKRIGRYDEAIEVYDVLLKRVPDSRVMEVTVNLATVLLAKGEPQDALWRLKPLSAAHPERPEIWGNLALAHRDLGRFEEAAAAFRRAIAVAPYRGDLQVQLAGVLLEDQGAVGLALTALDLAGRQGETSQTWYVRIRACYQLLGDERSDAEVRALAERDLPADVVEELDRHVAELVANVRQKHPAVREPQM